MSLQVGDIISFERTFTKEDVGLFTKVSRDEGNHQLTPEERGRLVVQGLLTANLPTKVGGEHNVLARKMNFEFLRPVMEQTSLHPKLSYGVLHLCFFPVARVPVGGVFLRG